MIKIILFITCLLLSGLGTSVVYHKTQQSDIYYFQGHRFLKSGKFDQAIEFCKKSLVIKPKRLDALEDIAYSYQWTGRHKEAIQTFRRILSINPKDTKIKKSLAITLAWEKEFIEAENIYQQVIESTDDYEARLELAQVLIWNKQLAQAEDFLRRMFKMNPKDFRLKLLLAKTLLYEKKTEEAIRLYEESLKERSPIKDKQTRSEVQSSLGQAYLIQGDYAKAIKEYEDILKKDPGDIKAKLKIADMLSWQGKYHEATEELRDVLKIYPDNLEAKGKLAAILSWDKQYNEARQLFREVLNKKQDKLVWLQEARVLGWEKKYKQALEEYRQLFVKTQDPLVKLEMQAKSAYWDNRVKEAIAYYRQLIEQDPQNEEARFDLSQIYSYQSRWKEAINEYEAILDLTPNHFRARQGLKKAKLISSHLRLQSGYEFYEADSPSRQDDIKRNTFFNILSWPLNYDLGFNYDNRLTNRQFSDFGDVLEIEQKFKLIYKNNPSWWMDTFYDLATYNKGIHHMNTFGGSYTFRFQDKNTSGFSYSRQRLENASTVIRENFYSDNFQERLDFDLNKRLKLGADYLFANYLDGNNKQEPGIDLLYYFSLDPKRLSLRYRYFYMNYLRKSSAYFSPKGFSTNALKINWRHFLNKEEIFFGADDLYYDLSYEASVDSTGIVAHKFSAGFKWDINKRLNLNIQGSDTQSSAGVYRDQNILASLNYYF